MRIDSNLIDWNGLHTWEAYSDSIQNELRQCLDEGRDVAAYTDVVNAIAALPRDALKEELCDALAETLTKAPLRPHYPYDEPDALDEIRAARPDARLEQKSMPDEGVLRDKIRGAWLGRICGCLLGKPVEGWFSGDIKALAEAEGNWPLSGYLMRDEAALKAIGKADAMNNTWADNLGGAAPADDDTNYTTMAALKLIDKYGRDFTPNDVARVWVDTQPKHAYCTAERRAFRNFVAGIMPPASATYRNPDREYIGAQIRGDYYGYICPGDTEQAADMAWRDACISHVKNGIYGEMFIAAMLARAAVSDDIVDIINAGLAEIPAHCRLSAAIRRALDAYKSGVSEGEAFERLHALYNERVGYDWVHTIPNAEIVTLCLLYGGGVYGRSICMAVMQGFDTDCNAATVGSILGMRGGEAIIDAHWTKPICGRLRTQLFGCEIVTIDELTELTLKHIYG